MGLNVQWAWGLNGTLFTMERLSPVNETPAIS